MISEWRDGKEVWTAFFTYENGIDKPTVHTTKHVLRSYAQRPKLWSLNPGAFLYCANADDIEGLTLEDLPSFVFTRRVRQNENIAGRRLFDTKEEALRRLEEDANTYAGKGRKMLDRAFARLTAIQRLKIEESSDG